MGVIMRLVLSLASFHLFAAASLYAQVLLTEVMFDPAGNENYDEFLEIYNASSTDTVSLDGWQIGDQSETDLFVSVDGSLALAPHRYAVILDAGYFANSGVYDNAIPAEAFVLTINDAAFGSGGLSNATAEAVVLISSAGDTVASYRYSLGNPSGFSDEKIRLTPDDSFANWGNARILGGTPGQRNSLTAADYDLALDRIRFLPPKPERGQDVYFQVPVHNLGSAASSAAQLRIAVEIASARVFIDSVLIAPLSPGGSLIVESRWRGAQAGIQRIVLFLTDHVDENRSNDSARVDLAVRWPLEILRINEVMFAPAAGEAEWLEIFNPTGEDICLAGWRVQDESGRTAVLADSVCLGGRGYAILAGAPTVQVLYQLPDSVFVAAKSFPTLNNEGDVIRLLDVTGAVIDSLSYAGYWGGLPGVSLEKVWYERANEAANWLASLAAVGATPARLNSRSPRSVDVRAGALCFDPVAARAGDEVKLLTTAYNSGRHPVVSPSVTFYIDGNGDGALLDDERIGTVLSSAALQPEDSLTLSYNFIGHSSGRFAVAAIWQTAGDVNISNDSSFATLLIGYAARSVVINEILYDPEDDAAEWVELFNRGDRALDLRGWKFSDESKTTIVADTIADFLLPPGELLILAGKALSWPVRTLVVADFPAFNNDQDKLSVRDFSGTTQDSVHYLSEWGGSKGISLERINPDLAGNDARNWSGCVNRNGGTPGTTNSIYAAIVPQQTAISVAPNPFSPDGDGRDDFAIIQFHLPVTTAAVHLKIFDLRGRLVRHLLNNAPVGFSYQIVWNGAGEGGETLRMGLYVLFLQALSATHGVVYEARTTVVLAKRL